MADVADVSDITGARRPSGRKRAKSVRAASPQFLERKNRWKRRSKGREAHRIYLLAGVVLVAIAALTVFILRQNAAIQMGPDGPFARAVAEAFPEADRLHTRTFFAEMDGYGQVPVSVTLHLPAYLLGYAEGLDDPFERLGAEFGIVQGRLSGLEMGDRVERIAAQVLPSDLSRCQTYEVGKVALDTDRVATRPLHIFLNPGC